MQLQAPWFKPAAWGVVVGAIGSTIIGFSWLGWTLGSTAERMAAERVNAAMIVAHTPSCVASFMQQRGSAAKLAEFQKIESWKQREFIEAGGWATPRGDTMPNSGVAAACAKELAKART